MAAEYSLDETSQSQVGEFKYLYVDGKEVNLQDILDRLEGLENGGGGNPDPDTPTITITCGYVGEQLTATWSNCSEDTQTYQWQVRNFGEWNSTGVETRNFTPTEPGDYRCAGLCGTEVILSEPCNVIRDPSIPYLALITSGPLQINEDRARAEWFNIDDVDLSTYQWQKLVSGSWTDVENEVTRFLDATEVGTFRCTGTYEGTYSKTESILFIDQTQFDATPILDRLTALEGSQIDPSILSDLSTNVEALQTRIGTLESLVGLLTNNNTNDTAIEHRLSRLEKVITALKSMHEAKKAVYNIPLDW